MRYILLVLLAFVTTFASAQVQFLGSPTTTVRNRGNFVSDSLFYLPKRQKLPSDTGALRYQISDSALYVWTGSAWRSTGTAGSAITGSGVAGYMPEFTTSTNLDTTRLYHSAGRFAIGSTTTTNGVFNVYSGQSYMDSTLKIGNGELIVGSTTSASRKLYVTSNSDVARFEQTASDKNMVIELRHTNPNASGTIREQSINFLAPNTSARGRITFYPSDTFNVRNYLAFFTPSGSGTNAERMRIANDGEIYVNGTSDAGDFKMQVYGNQYIQGILGLGTTSPSTELHILSSTGYAEIRLAGASGSGGSIEFYDATTQLGDIYVDPSRNMVFRNQNEAMRINSSRELLIGTTTDAGAYSLQVAGAMYATGNLNFAGGDISISNISNNVLAFGTNNTERMRIGANGDVAIGTTNADPFTRGDDRRIAMDASGISSTANVALSLNAGSSAGRGAQLYLGVGGTRHFEISSNSVEQGISAISNTYIKFLTNNTERMRLKADGEVLIGTTSDAGAYALQVAGSIYNTTGAVFAASSGNVGIGTTSPAYKLAVRQATQGVLAEFRTIDGTDNPGLNIETNASGTMLMQVYSAGNTKTLQFGTNSTERLRIHENGGLKFVGQSAAPHAEAGTVYYDTDDNKLKVYNGTTWVDLH